MSRWMLWILTVMVACLMGCDDNHDDDDDARKGRNYMPPEGQGAIIVENETFSDWNVQINGQRIGRVASFSFLIMDEAPGSYRVHLDQHSGSEEEDALVGVQAGALSVVQIDGDNSDFDVNAFTLLP